MKKRGGQLFNPYVVSGKYNNKISYNDAKALKNWNYIYDNHKNLIHSLYYHLETNLVLSKKLDGSFYNFGMIIKNITDEDFTGFAITKAISKMFSVNVGDTLEFSFVNSNNKYSMKIDKIVDGNDYSIVLDESIMKTSKNDDFFNNLYINELTASVTIYSIPIENILETNKTLYEEFVKLFDNVTSLKYEMYLEAVSPINNLYIVMLIVFIISIITIIGISLYIFLKKDKSTNIQNGTVQI